MASVFANTGKQYVVDKIRGSNTNSPNQIGWGSGAGTSAVTDTTLFSEATESRVTGTMSSPSAYVFQVVGTLTADGTKTITNAGVFDAATAGNLILKADFAGVPLLANDSIEFTFQLTVS